MFRSHTVDDLGMIPMSYEVAETGVRRATICNAALHSVCRVVNVNNLRLKLYPVYC